MSELLIEILMEEIPARMQTRAAADLKKLAAEQLAAAKLDYTTLETYVTPRRLVLVVNGLPTAQADYIDEIKGPRRDAPEQALKGFLQTNGLSSFDNCEQRQIGKATHYIIVKQMAGQQTPDLLPPIIQIICAQFPWPKSMRWADRSDSWVRPITQIFMLFDGNILSDAKTISGHRFLAPEQFTVTGFADYQQKLRDRFVILDAAERKVIIWQASQKIAADNNLILKPDDGLLEELTGLVEWPVPMLGSFNAEFLQIPSEVLVASMRAHQKYLPLFDRDGKLAPHFILIANILGNDGGHRGSGHKIVAGNERVLRARLSDAKFFYEQDLKTPLAARLEKLKGITFHAKLGSIHDKVERMRALAAELVPFIAGADASLADRAALLAKADLTSGMVGEFPELQGIMGRYYAINDNEAHDVPNAIADHYQPLGPAAPVPTAPVSIAVALADKLDSLRAFFGAGEKPTGSKDPYALRRAALGVIRIIRENNLRLPLLLFVPEDLLQFMRERLAVMLRDEGIPHDVCAAVLHANDDLVSIAARAAALHNDLRSRAEWQQLLTAYQRAANILKAEEKKDGAVRDGTLDASLLTDAAEQQLVASLADIVPTAEDAIAAENFAAAMMALAGLAAPLDAFFTHIMVNADDKFIRINRLNLLARVRNLYHIIADFSKIEG